MNRRSFLQTSATLAGAAATGTLLGCADTPEPSDVAPATAGSGLIQSLGVQLYTLRSLLTDDFDATLQAVADIGYGEVEFAGYYDRDLQALRQQLDALGLAATAAHFPLASFQNDLDGVLEAAAALGHRYVVCPWLGEDERGGAARYRELAELFNDIGAQCAAAGVRFAYHNHDFEFETDGGQVLYDVLLEGTDPEVVAMELDLFWINAAGYDPMAYFERYPGRFELLHIKDRTADGAMVAVGAGTIDFAAILAQAEQGGVQHQYVEHDNPEDPLVSIRASYQHLQAL